MLVNQTLFFFSPRLPVYLSLPHLPSSELVLVWPGLGHGSPCSQPDPLRETGQILPPDGHGRRLRRVSASGTEPQAGLGMGGRLHVNPKIHCVL